MNNNNNDDDDNNSSIVALQTGGQDEPSSSSNSSKLNISSSRAANITIPLNLEVDTTESLTAVAGHVCVSYRGCLICWGGYCYDEREIHYRECNWLYILPYKLCGERNNVWLKVQCETDLQLRPNSGSTACVHRDHLYIFGGCLFDETHRRMVNTAMLIAINLRSGILFPMRFPPNEKIPTPRDKASSWIADNKFFIFGGYGMTWHRLDHSNYQYFFQPQSFLNDDMGSCWNNQLIYYDLQKECFREVDQGGQKPCPRAAAASAHVPELNQVFLFGGRHDQTRLNDLFMLDLGSLVWTQLDTPVEAVADSLWLPRGRSWCSLTYLHSQKKILCYGGLCSRSESLNDLWELDITELYNERRLQQQQQEQQQYSRFFNDDDENDIGEAPSKISAAAAKPHQGMAEKKHRWRQIPPLEHRLPSRLWHCAVTIDDEAMLIYGGMNEAPSRVSPFVRTLIVHRLAPPSLRQLAFTALAANIVNRWILHTRSSAFKHQQQLSPDSAASSSAPSTSTNPPPFLDLQRFVETDGILRNLPVALHPHLRVLIAIRKHAKALNPSGGCSPRGTSPAYRWQPSPVPQNFHLLNLDGMIGDNEEEDDDDLNRQRRRAAAFRNVPLSANSQKRALADELVKLVCGSGGGTTTTMAAAATRSRRGEAAAPFLQTLFNYLDL